MRSDVPERAEPFNCCGRGDSGESVLAPSHVVWLRAVRTFRLFFCAGVAALALNACESSRPVPPPSPDASVEAGATTLAAETAATGYAPRAVCQTCHAAEHASWTGSHHDRAMEEPTPTSILGRFDGSTFRHRGREYGFDHQDGAYSVSVKTGTITEIYPVRYTFGVEPLQQYLVETRPGRIQAFSVAWDTHKQTWFHLYPDEDLPPGDPLHFDGVYQNWTAMCADCHSTGVKKTYQPEQLTHVTTFQEIDVSCQSCHGPSLAHANSPKEKKTATFGRKQIDTCAACHARRSRVSGEEDPVAIFVDNYRPATLREGLYHADGQMLDEVYVYGSFLQSKMHQKGVTCADCHNPHSLKLAAEGNALCTRCHATGEGDPRFPTAKKKNYDSPSHHHHPQGSESAQCVNCHMPATTYMVVDPRRDHSFRIPRPDLTERIQTPNACNGCHAKQPASWARKAVEKWYGSSHAPHFGEVFALARANDPAAGPKLIPLIEDPGVPGIVRATALELLGTSSKDAVRTQLTQLRSPDPLVRTAAVGALEALPGPARVSALSSALSDSVRMVRVEAARVLASVPPQEMPPAIRKSFSAALAELVSSQQADRDLPGGAFMLGRIGEDQGRTEDAVTFYREALRLDPGFLPAIFNLANLYNRTGQNSDAELLLRRGLGQAPNNGELHYSLALLLAEQKQFDAADAALKKAILLLPERARLHYNRALLLKAMERFAEAESEIKKALNIEPKNPDFLFLAATFFLERQKPKQALPYAESLKAILPDAPGPKQLVQQIMTTLQRDKPSKRP
jgi:predicted CXXCH cytochrome family protein